MATLLSPFTRRRTQRREPYLRSLMYPLSLLIVVDSVEYVD